MTAYATLADLQSYLGTPPESGDDRLLRRASDLLDSALIASIYDVDALGNPTAAADIAALRDAACAQVESWKATGDERGDVVWQEMSLGPAKLVRHANKAGDLAGVGIAAERLCPRALEALRVAGLWPGKPVLR
jgi:hypothetical protein